jgi:uncharacterized protein involved in exopolysaccharide biosynthesis
MTQHHPIDEQTFLGEKHVSLLDLLLVMALHKRRILKWILGTAIFGLLLSFCFKTTYRGMSSIMPPQQPESVLSLMAGQIAGVASADLGLKNPSDLWVGLLGSTSVLDFVIKHNDLQKVYKCKVIDSCENKLRSRTDLEEDKSGIILINADDTSPDRAAAIANSYIDGLFSLNNRMAVTEAAQRRSFYEEALQDEKNQLSDAEVAMAQTQLKTGVLSLPGQTLAAISAVESVHAQLAEKQVELEAMKTTTTSLNPDQQRLETEIAALQHQLNDLENSTKKRETGNVAVPAGQVPNEEIEYIRRERDVSYHQMLYELLAREYEGAKIDEAKAAPIVQIVDRASPPAFKHWPPRLIFMICGGFLGFLIGAALVFFGEVRRKMRTNPEDAAKMDALRGAIRVRR